MSKTRSDPKYLLDSLFYLAGSQAPYIHVILSYIVSITWYINQPLVRLLTVHYQSAVSMISFAQVLTAQWSNTIPSQNVEFQVGIDLTLFHFNRSLLVWMTQTLQWGHNTTCCLCHPCACCDFTARWVQSLAMIIQYLTVKTLVLLIGPRWRIRWYVGVYQSRDETGSLE